MKKEVLFQKQRYADKLCQIQDLEEKFAEKSSAHDKGLQTLQLLLIKTKEMHVEIERLKSRHVCFIATILKLLFLLILKTNFCFKSNPRRIRQTQAQMMICD